MDGLNRSLIGPLTTGNMPKISFIIPTLNSKRTVGACIASIHSQDYPSDKIDILVVDGGSTDGTIQVLGELGVSPLTLHGGLQEGPSGQRAVGIELASGDYICLVDSDNILGSSTWLRGMLAPFCEKGVGLSECGVILVDKNDCHFARYISRVNGDPIAYILSETLTSKIRLRATHDYLLLPIMPGPRPTVGTNGVLVPKSVFLKSDGYVRDTDILSACAKLGYTKYARVTSAGLFHKTASTFGSYVRKRIRYITLFSRLFVDQNSLPSVYLSDSVMRRNIMVLLLSSLVGIPSLLYARRGLEKDRDVSWLYHPLTLLVESIVYLLVYLERWRALHVSKN